MRIQNDIDKLADQFYREFARCEYCLKTVGLLTKDRNAKADWDAFAIEMREALENPISTELKDALEYLLSHPPKKQINRNNVLDWDDALPTNKSKAEVVLLLVRRIRNNLFHGGKFNGDWFDPQRSEELITHGLVILKMCIKNHPLVREAYEQPTV